MTSKSTLTTCLLVSTLATTAHAALDDQSEGGGDPNGTNTSEGPNTIAHSFSYAPTWGTSDWGVSVSASGVISATPAASLTDRDRATASGQLSASAKVNGTRYRLLGARANGDIENGRKSKFYAAATVGTAEIWNYASESNRSANMVALVNEQWERTLLDQRVGVWVGPVPVEFRVQVEGQLGANIDASLNLTRIGVIFTPRASASLFASAAIGGEACLLGACVGASAGIYGEATLFSVSIPSRIEIALTPLSTGLRATGTLRSDATVSTLDGELGLIAEAHAGPFDDEWRLPLIEWGGVTSTTPLVNVSPSYCLVGTCMTSAPSTPRK